MYDWRGKPLEAKTPEGAFAFTLKITNVKKTWQYNDYNYEPRGNILMPSMAYIFNKTCEMLGYNISHLQRVYLFTFADKPFTGWQICLVKSPWDPSGPGKLYKVSQSKIGDFEGEGVIHDIVRTRYLKTWPEKIYYKMETHGMADR